MFNFFRRKCPNCKQPRTKSCKYCMYCGAPYRLSKLASTIEQPPIVCIYGPPPPSLEIHHDYFDPNVFGGFTTEGSFGFVKSPESDPEKSVQDDSADVTDMADNKSSKESEVHDHL